jgi:hypothetical protein
MEWLDRSEGDPIPEEMVCLCSRRQTQFGDRLFHGCGPPTGLTTPCASLHVLSKRRTVAGDSVFLSNRLIRISKCG